jgi:non-specific serine/threonine protein kinase/serine/threonine-protein kinase
MGEVWVADQLQPVKRKVAVKVIKAGMDTKQVVARFESERQALALMDHPAIAKVFDGGTTSEGRPYFVMEYVPGVPITKHCDTHQLPLLDRLPLFCEVCEGVQHAHQKGIIHRDLKPSNILVSLTSARAQPKVIDFGIAKATGHRLTEKTLFTEVGSVVGTPEYMSPEQAESGGQDVDTRTDVYSLGVIFYELLTGELPFRPEELRTPSFEELRRILREEEPQKPSRRLSNHGERRSEAARRRSTDAGSLQREVKGDLDAITLKAIAKDRARRYGTPTEFAADIGRYLRHEPVLARAPSARYRATKFVKRHRIGVAMAAALLALLFAFAASMSVQVRRTAQERDRANRQRDALNKVSEFQAAMLSSLEPEAVGRALWKNLHDRVRSARLAQGEAGESAEKALASLDELLAKVSPTDTAMQFLDEEILERAGKAALRESDPRIAGSIEYMLGTQYAVLGLPQRAEPHMQRSLEIRTKAFGAQDFDTLRSLSQLGWVMQLGGRLQEAAGVLRRALDAQRATLGNDHPSTLSSMTLLASVDWELGRYAEAKRLDIEALEARRRALGPDHWLTLQTMNALSSVYASEGDLKAAERILRELADIQQRSFAPDSVTSLRTMNNLGDVLCAQGRWAEGREYFLKALDGRRRVLGSENPTTLMSMGNVGNAYEGEGRFANARQILEEALSVKRKVLGPDHNITLDSAYHLAHAYNGERRFAEAETLARETLARYEHTSANDNESGGGVHLALGKALLGLRRYQEAEHELLEAQRRIPSANVYQKRCLQVLVALYEMWPGDHARELAVWRARLDESHP